MGRRWVLMVFLLFTTRSLLFADQFTIDFEGVADSTSAAALYSAQGVTFSSGVILVSGAFGGSLNELDFPPLPPGQAVFVNEADTTTLTFSQPILSFSGYFTYGGPITINFYDAGNALLTTLTSAFLTNIATGGDPGSSPNELLAANNLANAVRAAIVATNTDFTLDNLSFTTAETPQIPEPGTLLLVSTLGALLFLARRSTSRLRP